MYRKEVLLGFFVRIFFVKYNEFDPNWANSTLQQQKKLHAFSI